MDKEQKKDRSNEFNFEDSVSSGLGPDKIPNNQEAIKPENVGTASYFDTTDFNLAHLIGKETLSWVRGDLEGKPQEIKQLGEDFAQKLNWYVACTILAQYARVPAMFDVLNKVSEKMFQKDIVDNIVDPKQLTDMYSSITKEIGSITEFARKFVVQNKDFLADNSNFFDRSLFEKIKALPTEMVRDYLTLFQIVEHKGQDVLKKMIEQYK